MQQMHQSHTDKNTCLISVNKRCTKCYKENESIGDGEINVTKIISGTPAHQLGGIMDLHNILVHLNMLWWAGDDYFTFFQVT